MDGSTQCVFFDREVPDLDIVMQTTIDVCANLGLAPEGESPDDFDSTDPSFDDPSDPLKLYWYGNEIPTDVTLSFEEASSPSAFLTVSTSAAVVASLDEPTANEYTGFTEVFVELVQSLAIAHDPTYVSNLTPHSVGSSSPIEVVPSERSFELERIPWLSVYSASLLDRFGWTDRVHDAPAWRVEQLPTGAVMLIKTKDPWGNVNRDHPLDHFLLDGEDPADESRDDVDLADPFAALEVGEYGADVCLHRDDIARSFPNEDLRLLRVEVDEERNLRRTDTGTFIRNVVDADPGDDADLVGRMLSDIPTDASDEDLHVSALLHAAVPAAFVRLDGPEDENLVTKVMGLDLNVSKVELLIALGRVAQHDDFTQENLDSMEGAMDTLAQLDAEAATQYVRENFL